MKATTRDVNDIAIIKVDGKITIGAGDQQLRDVIAGASSNKILLDLSGVTTIDSSGTSASRSRRLKTARPSSRRSSRTRCSCSAVTAG